MMFPLHGKPEVHSATSFVMKNAFLQAGIVIDCQECYGLRPPQHFFCYANDEPINEIENEKNH